MRKYFYLLLIPVFFLIGCENYRCELETEIYPTIHIIGQGEETKIIMEYELGPLNVIDPLKDTDEVDAFFLVEKKDTIENSPIKLKIRRGSLSIRGDGTHYYIHSKEYSGEEGPSLQLLYDNREAFPEMKWTVFDGVEYKNGAPREVVLGLEEEKIQESTNENKEITTKSKHKERKKL